MASTVFKAGNTALITGGASGIGLALAKKCHSYGMKVAIVDINKEHLELAKKSLGERTSTYAVDVGKIDEWQSLKKKIDEEFGHIDLLALNAGIGPRGTWSDLSYFHQTLNTNLFGVINGISTFLPSLQAAAAATTPTTQHSAPAIVITGSKQGITNPPGNPAYNASKAAVKTLAEHLAFDLRHSSIAVHLLVPGWTHTGLTGAGRGSVEAKPAGAWTPEQVVEYLLGAMAAGRFYVICPDNDVSEEMDRKRMLWGVGDLVQGRPPLTRWREEWKDRAEEGVRGMSI